jgi:peptidoglycan hydrolase-like protein with peptidoglycan-binding domain
LQLSRFPIASIILLFIFLAPASIWARSTSSSHNPKHKSAVKKNASHKGGTKSKSASKKGKGKKAWQAKGQQSISDDRTREIQTALIREKYLTGEPTGQMDGPTRQALIKLQEQNGWQTKIVPDSRALIKLGLGPNHENLLNPETAAMPSAVASRQ